MTVSDVYSAPPAPPPDPRPEPVLADTGAAVLGPALLGVGLVVVGAVMLVGARRRTGRPRGGLVA